jgi:hypothetical protein
LLLTYASLEEAIQKKVRRLRWGSGAYDVKKKMGFEMDNNNFVVVSSNYFPISLLIKIFS